MSSPPWPSAATGVILVAALLLDASARTQLVVTTHSDILVDALTDTPEAIVVCEKVGGSTSRASPSGRVCARSRSGPRSTRARVRWRLRGVRTRRSNGYAFIRVPAGSNSAVPIAATVTGKVSFMYMTCSRSPTRARSTGR